MRYRYPLLLAVLIAMNNAHAITPRECIAACDLTNKESQNLKCSIFHMGTGVMFLEQQKPFEDKDRLRLGFLRDCFFKTGGGILEIHGSQKGFFASCSPTAARVRAQNGVTYVCDKTPVKESLRGHKSLKPLRR